MKTTIKYSRKTFIELDNNNPRMISTKCKKCSNPLHVPIGVIVLGLVTDCGHCGKNYPAQAHCEAITSSYLGLIANTSSLDEAGEQLVSLD